MKLDKFLFELFVTLWIPGSVISAGLFVVLGGQWEHVQAFLAWAKDSQVLAIFVVGAVLTFCGVVLAAVHGVLEEFILDRWYTPWKLRITRETFKKEWSAYVWDLPNRPNTYIERLVLFFSLETRMALACLFLTCSVWSHGWTLVIVSVVSIGTFYSLGLIDHRALAEYRHDNYPNGRIPDPPKAKPPAKGGKAHDE